MSKFSYRQKSYGSVFKLIKCLGYLAKANTSVTIEGVTEEYLSPNRITISPSFFRNFRCMSCGRCCMNFSLAYTSSDIDAMKERKLSFAESTYRDKLVESLIEVPVIIYIDNPQAIGARKEIATIQHKVMCYLHSNDGKRCKFIRQDGDRVWCNIHWVKPNHCALPSIHIDKNLRGSARLIKRQFGRNWQFGCPSVVEEFDYKTFVEWDLPLLRKLLQNADDLRLETWLTEIVGWLSEHLFDLKGGMIPTKPIVIYDKKLGIPDSYMVKKI